jgi:colanic acid biosynthesis glycosyl transferase WcaI
VKLLIHSINYAPELISTGKYNGEMAEWLAERGHEVKVVTAPPYYPAWRVMKGYSAWRYQREFVAGVEVWRCPLWVPAEPSGIKRLLHLVSFTVGSLPAMLKQIQWRPDVVIVTEPPLLCVPQASFTARVSGAKAWLHVLDFELDAAIDLGMLSGGKMRRYLHRAEKFLLRRVDQVSTISEKMRRRIVAKGVPEERSQLFLNWSDLEIVRPMARDNDMRQIFDAGAEDVLVLYAGNLGEKQGLELVLDAAARLKDRPEIKFAMVGDGAAKEKLERLAHDRKLDNVRFYPVQPLERLAPMLAAGDIHLVVQRREAADLVMPSKLTNILAAGRSSIGTADPDTALYEILEEHGCGIVTTPGSVTELVEGIVALAEDGKRRNELGRNARQYAETYLDKNKVLLGFEQELQQLVKTEGRSLAAELLSRPV